MKPQRAAPMGRLPCSALAAAALAAGQSALQQLAHLRPSSATPRPCSSRTSQGSLVVPAMGSGQHEPLPAKRPAHRPEIGQGVLLPGRAGQSSVGTVGPTGLGPAGWAHRPASCCGGGFWKSQLSLGRSKARMGKRSDRTCCCWSKALSCWTSSGCRSATSVVSLGSVAKW